jgi:Anti-sigma factor NepR
MHTTDKNDEPKSPAQSAASAAAAPSGSSPGLNGGLSGANGDGIAEVELTEGAQRLIGLHLKQLYQQIVAEPVPDEFLRLLDELEQRERET